MTQKRMFRWFDLDNTPLSDDHGMWSTFNVLIGKFRIKFEWMKEDYYDE